jgi:hypothetical protein
MYDAFCPIPSNEIQQKIDIHFRNYLLYEDRGIDFLESYFEK